MFYSIQLKSGLFGMFAQSVKFYTLHYHVLRVQMFEKWIHQIDGKYEWSLLSASFKAKFGLVFVLTLENAFS